MQDWLEFLPLLALAAAVVMIPGAVLAYLVGARGFLVVGLAGPISYSVVGGAAMVGPWLGLDWGLSTLVPIAIGCAAVAWCAGRLLGRFVGPSESDGVEPWHSSLGAVSLGASISVFLHARMVGDPQNFADRFDNVFHLNAAEYAVRTGKGSPFEIGGVTSGDSAPAFYPSVWHDLVSCVAKAGSSSVVEAANAVNMAVVAGVWITGAVLLGRLWGGDRPRRAGAIAAVVACAFPAFPHLLFEWGTLYPNATGFAALPAMTYLGLVIARRLGGSVPDGGPSLALAGVLVIMASPGIALAHPSSMLVAGLAFACVVVGAVPRALSGRRARPAVARRVLVISMGTVVAVSVLWIVVRPSLAAADWRAFTSTPEAMYQAVTSSVMDRSVPYPVTALVAIGAMVAVLRREWGVLLFWSATCFLYVVAASSTHEAWRNAVTGGFYRDNYRLAAATVIGALPLAVLGGVWLLERGCAVLERGRRTTSEHARAALAATLVAAMVLLVVASSYRGALRSALDGGHYFYTVGDMLDEDERRLLREMPDVVPDDAVVLGIPRTGSAYSYAIGGVDVGEAHMFYTPTKPVEVLERHLSEADDPAHRTDVCDAVASLDRPLFVLDFADRLTGFERTGYYGLRFLRPPVAELVKAVGEAKLLRVTACDGPRSPL